MNAIDGACFGLILLLAIFLRVRFLHQPIHYDEAFTFTNYASQPLRIALADYSAPNNHVFHTLLVHLSYRLLGAEPWAIRLPAFVAGVLIVPASYWAARSLYDKRAALLAAACTATSGPLIAYATNARGYSLICLAFLLLLGLALQIKHGGSKVLWLPFVLLAALGFYTIPIMLYPFGVVVVWLGLMSILGTRPPSGYAVLRDLIVVLPCVGMLTALFYLPILLRAGLAALVGNRFVAPQSWPDILETAPIAMLGLWLWWSAGLPLWAIVLFGAGLVASSVAYWRLRDDRTLLAVAFVLWILVVILGTRTVPMGRVWLFLLPAVLIIASGGLSVLIQWLTPQLVRPDYVVAPLALLLAAGTGVTVLRTQMEVDRTYGDTASLQDGRAIAASLKAWLQPGDKILTAIPVDAPLEYYLTLMHVPRSHLAWPSKRPTARPVLEGSARLLVVVDEGRGQTLEEVLQENKLDRGDYGAAVALQRYASGSVVYAVTPVQQQPAGSKAKSSPPLSLKLMPSRGAQIPGWAVPANMLHPAA